MSEVKVNKISPRSGTTITLGDSGDTITIPSGVTLNTLGTLSSLTVAGNVSIDGGTIKLDGNLDNNGNVALGNNTLASGSFTGNFNTAIGSVSLTNTTSGDNNVGIGSNSLQNNTTGSNNIAIGKNALDSSQTNSNVIAIGTDTLERNTTDNNVGIGYQALQFNTTGNSNTGVGYHALQNNISGSALTAFGQQTLDKNTTGLGNTAVGYQALINNTTTDHNTALGYSAGSTVTTGSNLTLLGSDAEPSSATATNEITLGNASITPSKVRTGNGSILASTPAFEAYRSTNQTITNLTATKVQFDTEVFDTNNVYDNATNYRFTPNVAGKYFVYSQLEMQDTLGVFNLSQINIELRKNGSTFRLSQMYYNALAFAHPASIYGSIDMNGTTDYLEIFVTTRHNSSSSSRVFGSNQSSFFGAYKLIGV